MANIIRIRNLSGETNLNQAIVIPVDCDSYGINAKKISIYDLKSWILSGFTGGGGSNTSCTGITSNIIKVIVTGTTTTTTTSSTSSTTTTTTTTTTSPSDSRIYFNSSATGALAVINQLGRTFDMTFRYEISAQCDSPIYGPVLTELRLTTDGNVTNSIIDSVTSNNGYVSKTGITSLVGVYNVSNVIFYGNTSPSCSDNNSGTVRVTITAVSITLLGPGTVTITCNDIWRKYCSLGTLTNAVSCSTSPTTTTSTTIPMVYYKLRGCAYPYTLYETYCPVGTFNYGPPDKVQGSTDYYQIYGPPVSISFGLPTIPIENLSYVCTGGCDCIPF